MEALEKIWRAPDKTLSFKKGKEIWGTKKPLMATVPSKETQRTVLKELRNGKSSDDIILRIMRMNPGTKLQACNENGVLPYLAMHKGGKKEEKLSLPDGVSVYAGAIWVENPQREMSICLMELY